MRDVQSLLTQFEHTQQALITVHEFPDLDAVGAALALYLYLKSKHKEVTIWIAQPLDDTFDFLPCVDVVVQQIPRDFVFDTIFVLDCSNTDRVRHFSKLPISDQLIVNIDHHPDNEMFGDINYVKIVSSVGEILADLFITNQFTLTPEIATCLYAAVVFDTGRFAYSNVTAHTFKIASNLISAGANVSEINSAIEENKSQDDLIYLKSAIDALSIDSDYRIAYTSVTVRKCQKIIVIDFIRQLADIDVFLVFQVLNDNLIKVNLRSKTDFDVSAFSKQFGGGGHRKAAGILYKGSLQNCRDELLSALKNAL